MENKIQLFEGVKVRYAWDAESEEWMFSAADVCNVLAESASKDPTAYWRKLKQRLLKEGSEVVTNCHELKMKASNGKLYQTDCFTTADTLRLIQSIPSPKAEPFKMWLAQVGSERLDEIADPEKAILRGADYYRAKGYPEAWINQRLQTIEMRKELTDEWKARQPETFSQSRNIAKEGGSVAKNAREDIESRLGHSILSKSNASDKKALDIKPELAE